MNADEQRSPGKQIDDLIRRRAADQQRHRFERVFGVPAEETPADSDDETGSDEAGSSGTA